MNHHKLFILGIHNIISELDWERIINYLTLIHLKMYKRILEFAHFRNSYLELQHWNDF